MNKNMLMIKSIIAALSMSAIILSLVSCNSGHRDVENSMSGDDNTVIETYRYLPESVNISHITGLIHEAIVHEGRIYVCYVVEKPDYTVPAMIYVESMLSDGAQLSHAAIPVSFNRVDVAALNITNEGNLALIVTGVEQTEQGLDSKVLYLEYTLQGDEVVGQELSDLALNPNNPLSIEQAAFTHDGNIVLTTADGIKAFVCLFDNQRVLRNQMEINSGEIIITMRNGRVAVSDSERSTNSSSHTALREICFETFGWGEAFPFYVTNIRGLYSAPNDDSFDFYIDDGTHLIGYNITNGDRTPILNWSETGVETGFHFHLLFLDEWRLLLLISFGDFSTVDWRTECMILTRTARTELPEYEIITLGGFYIGDMMGNQSLHKQVQAFNRRSHTHRIEIVDYIDVYGSEDYNISEFRYLLDIITESAPDIILGEISSFANPAKRGFLVDLYPLIDQDPILSRSDFFQNVIGAIEAPDGSLPAISNWFWVETIIGMANVAGDIKSWTFADMLALVERAEDSDIAFILGEWMTAERFLDIALEFSGNDFINWSEKTSDLDSVEFIQLLEISARLPNIMAPWDFDNLTSPVMRMLRGEQLLDIIELNNIQSYQMYTAMLGDDIAALGLPTHTGGSHLIRMPSGFAISMNSKQKDAAWSFIREFLLPDVSQDDLLGGFPLRIDLFEEMIVEAKTSYFEVDEDGNEVETPHVGMGQADFMVWIYALTETEENGLRAIVENAHMLGSFNETVMNIVREETSTYFAGNRSAADTARVLQNRIQIFLHEIE